MDPRKQRPSTITSSGSSGGRFLHGVWMSRCEGGRVERLTKWSDDMRDKALGSLDRQQHDSMVKMNLMKLELRDELVSLRRSSRRRPPLKDAWEDSREVNAQTRPQAKPGPPGRMVLVRGRSTRSSLLKMQEAPRNDAGGGGGRGGGGGGGGDLRQLETGSSGRKASGIGVSTNRSSASRGKLGRHQQQVPIKDSDEH